MKAKIVAKEILWKQWGEYARYTLEYTRNDGKIETQIREIQDSGNGATILLYNLSKRSVILIRQFRLATLINGNSDGLMIETCAGLVENESPEEAIKREVLEETGYKLEDVNFLFDAYATPGAKTEKISFFIAPYDETMKTSIGGGHEYEQEEIEILEMTFDAAIKLWKGGKICDAKTIVLLQHAQIYIFKDDDYK